MSQKLIFYPLGNAETILFEMNNGEKMLFDFAAMKNPSNDDNLYDIVEEFSEIDSFKVVMFTHAHEDHTKGASDFFYFEHAKKYQSEERKKIEELWISSAFLLDKDLENGADAKVIRNEARYRLKNDLGIKVFASPGSLDEWVEENELDWDVVKDKIVCAGDKWRLTTNQDTIEFFVHAPFSEDSEDVDDKNEPSIVLQMSCINSQKATRIIITGDVPYSVLDKIVDISKCNGNEEYLKWNVYDIPHHCSYTGLNEKDDEEGEMIEPTDNIKWLLKQSEKDAYVIASCEKITKKTSPPHMIAKKAYEYYTKNDVTFLATMEYHNQKETIPEPIEFIIGSSGIELLSSENRYSYQNTEQFIEDKHIVTKEYYLKIDCKVTMKGRKTFFLRNYPERLIHRGRKLEFFIAETDCPQPYKVLWKVKNNGAEAEKRNCIRGELEELDNSYSIKKESADFQGKHYVECYLIRNDKCVASDRIDVCISRV